jgi:hypothetical protein
LAWPPRRPRRGLRNFAADLAIDQAAKQLVLRRRTDRALIAEFVAATRTAKREGRTRWPPLSPATPALLLDVVTAAKLDTAAHRPAVRRFSCYLGRQPELREFFVNPAIPAVQKVAILDKLNAKLGLQKELRNLLAVLINNDRIGQVQRSGPGLSQACCRSSWAFARRRL